MNWVLRGVLLRVLPPYDNQLVRFCVMWRYIYTFPFILFRLYFSVYTFPFILVHMFETLNNCLRWLPNHIQ